MHPLTEKIKSYKWLTPYETGFVDDIVRQWLSEKAKEIRKGVYDDSEVDRILGLESKQEEPVSHKNCNHWLGRKCSCKKEEVVEKKLTFCKTCHWGMEDEWKFCPRDGNPRPQEKSLEEKFLDTFSGTRNCKCSCGNPGIHVDMLTKIAKDHFASRKET